MKALKLYSIKMLSRIENLSLTVNDIINCLQDCCGDFEECALFELKVILNELMINAIKHGNKEDASKTVKVDFGVFKDRYVFFIIEDEGLGYNYECICENNKNRQDFCDLPDMKETGRGILIVKNLCEKMKFNKRGNKVIVVKKL
ncbi:MAG: ATP-binding protein [Clostridia bacterium]|nr:ATP-binding protein [Clostridia bacterium]